MAYLSELELRTLGFKAIGCNVKISDKASIYNCDEIEIGDNSRVDDFCVLSGKVYIGKYCHITPMCLVAGGVCGVYISDFCALAYGVKIFAQSDDYSGLTMTNSQVPKLYKNEIFESVHIGRHVIIGAGSCVLPGSNIAEGCSIGAMALVLKSTRPWGIYAGVPARRIKDRSKELLALEAEFLNKLSEDP